ncbi:MAG: DMT family transporter [Pontimonas sp.]|nr:DMT family transporter [Pontimonas sp.]
MGYFYALLAAFLFGANGSVSKVIIESGFSAIQLTQMRVFGAAVISGIVLLILDRRSFRLPPRQWPVIVILGVVGVGLLQATYAFAIALLPVGIALLLEYLAVLIVAVVAFFFFKENVHIRLWLAIGLVIVGLVVVAEIWSSTLNPIGVMWGLLAAVALATYFLVGERQLKTISPLALSFWTMSVATVFWAPFSRWWTFTGETFTTTASLGGTLENVSVPVWALVAWNVVLGSFAPFLLSLSALKRLSATAAGIVATSEIIFAFVTAWLWLQESLNTWQVVGASVVFGGIVIAQTARTSDVVVQADLALETGPIILPTELIEEK